MASRTERQRMRTEVLARLALLLEAPGTRMSTPELLEHLATLPLAALGALAYRVESGRAASYEEGVLAGRADDGPMGHSEEGR